MSSSRDLHEYLFVCHHELFLFKQPMAQTWLEQMSEWIIKGSPYYINLINDPIVKLCQEILKLNPSQNFVFLAYLAEIKIPYQV